jgi:hypothetical protein
VTCNCGKVNFDVQGDKIIVNAQGNGVVFTASKLNDTIKVEHLECQSCQTVYVPSE